MDLECIGALATATKTRGGPNVNNASDNPIVLLVEDSDDDAFFFERSFAMANVSAELVRVADGGAAVKYLEHAATRPRNFAERCVIFLDLKLPVLGGFEVLQWIRERGLAFEVIVLSGSDLESDITLARQLGASDYLAKPISAEAIRKRLTQIPNSHER